MVPFIDTCADMVEHFGADFCTGGCRQVSVPEKTPAKGGVLPAAFDDGLQRGQRSTDCLINAMDDNTPGGHKNGGTASAATKKSSWWPQSKRKTAKLFDCAKATKSMRRLCPCAVVEGAEGGGEGESGGGKVRYWYDDEGRASVEGA